MPYINLTAFRDRTAQWGLAVTAGGIPVDLTGKRLSFSAKYNFTDPPSSAVISKNSDIGGGIIVTSSIGGLGVMTFDPEDTTGLPDKLVNLYCDMVLVDGPHAYELFNGLLTISPNVVNV